MTRRKCTGTVSFITNDVNILQKIAPNSYTDFPVIIYRNNSPFFYGFLSPDTFETEYSTRYREITLNIVDALTALDYIPITDYYTKNKGNYITLKEILQEVKTNLKFFFKTSQTETVNMYVYYTHTLLRLIEFYTINADMLRIYHESEPGGTRLFEMKSIGEVLDMVMEITGQQMVQEGNRFLAFAYPYYWDMVEVDDATARPSVSERQFSYRGTNHCISAFAGARSITLSFNYEREDPDFELPEFPILDSYLEKNYSYTDNYNGKQCYSNAKIVQKADLFPELTLYYKRNKITMSDGSITSNTISDSNQTEYLNNIPIFKGHILWYTGVFVNNYTTSLFGGASFCELNMSDWYNTKKYTLRGLLLSDFYHTTPLASLKSNRNFYFEPGSYIRFTFEADTFPLPSRDYYNRCRYLSNSGEKKFAFTLRVGEYYAANGIVNSSSSMFYCSRKGDDKRDPFDRGGLIYNLTKEELTELGFSGDGYYFKVPHGGYQDIELSFLSYAESWGDDILYNNVKIEYLGVPHQDSFYNKDSYERKVIINANFSEDLDLEPAIVLKTNNRINYSDNELTDASGGRTQLFQPVYKDNYYPQSVKIEDDLVNRYKNFYKARRYKIELQTYIPYDFLFRACISTPVSKRAVLVAKSDDYRMEQSTLTFLDSDTRTADGNIEADIIQ